MEHPGTAQKSVVLVHGLTDSPYYMTAIGEFFFNELGHNVYMPLLHCHGLRKPNGMEDVKLAEWKENVAFAVKKARAASPEVSIGGLSTGGTLSFHAAMTNPGVTGTLSFSPPRWIWPAVSWASSRRGWRGSPGWPTSSSSSRGTGSDRQNPYRYTDVDKDGARELAKLIKETDALTREIITPPTPDPEDLRRPLRVRPHRQHPRHRNHQELTAPACSLSSASARRRRSLTPAWS